VFARHEFLLREGSLVLLALRRTTRRMSNGANPISKQGLNQPKINMKLRDFVDINCRNWI